MKRLGLLLVFALLACPAAHASPPADSTVKAITVVAGTASATYTCSGPASCLLSAVTDSISGNTVLAAQTLAPGASVTASMACSAAGGLLVWRNTAIGRTAGMMDAAAIPLRTSGNCPLAVSPGAQMVVSPITIGP